MTLATFLASLPANPDQPEGPRLNVSVGVMGDKDEAAVKTPEYGDNPYCYLLHMGDVKVQTYDNGSGRWNTPVDLVLECADTDKKPVMQKIIELLDQTLPDAVDEVRPGVPLAGHFVCTRFLPPEERRKGFIESTLVLETQL